MRQKHLVHFNERLMAMFLLRYTWYTHLSWALTLHHNIIVMQLKLKYAILHLFLTYKTKRQIFYSDFCHGPVWASGKDMYPSQLFWKLQTENSGSKSLLATGCCQQQDEKTFAEWVKLKQSPISIFIALNQNYCQYLVTATLPLQKQSFNLQKFAPSVFCCNKEHQFKLEIAAEDH